MIVLTDGAYPVVTAKRELIRRKQHAEYELLL